MRRWLALVGVAFALTPAVLAAITVSARPAFAADPPTLYRVLGGNIKADDTNDEVRADFIVRVAAGELPTQVVYSLGPTTPFSTTATRLASVAAFMTDVGQTYVIQQVIHNGPFDYLLISLHGDGNWATTCAQNGTEMSMPIRVTTASGSVDVPFTITGYNYATACSGQSRPIVATTFDNAWASTRDTSQDGFGTNIGDGGTATTPGVTQTGRYIIDAQNRNATQGGANNPADCGVTDTVYYQWVDVDNNPVGSLTPAPVPLPITSHFGDSNVSQFALENGSSAGNAAGFPATFDFTAAGPGYYKLLAWPVATSSNGTVDCSARTFTPGVIADAWQVGSVFYNFALPVPPPPVITAPADGSFTNDSTPTVTGTGEPGDTVTVTEGSTTVCTAVVAPAGTWSCVPTLPLPDGQHTILAVQTDPELLQSDPSGPTTFTVDTLAPAAPVIQAPASGTVSVVASPPISGTGEPGATVTVRDGSTVVCSAQVTAAGTWSCTPQAPLDEGSHTLVASQVDAAGNVSPDSTTVTYVVATPVFTQTKTADADEYIVGQPITYTVTVANTGNGDGTATVADTVPAGVDSVSVVCAATGTGTCDTTGSTGNAIAGSVSLGLAESAIYTISGVVSSNGTLTNEATITPTTTGCASQCGGGTASTPAINAGSGPFLTQTKTADSASYVVGQPITYTVTVTNTGAGAGTAALADTVPATVGSVTATCSVAAPATCNTTGSAGNGIAGAANLPAGASATFTITGVVTSAGSVANTATVTPTTVGCTTQCGGGTASTGALAAADNPVFTQTKTADSPTYIVGQPITYTVMVTNTGSGPGTASIADTVPAVVGSVNVTCAATAPATCDTTGSAGNTVAGTVSLGAGEVATFSLTGTVTGPGDATNAVLVTATTPGCVAQCGGGTAATEPLPVGAGPVFSQTKTADESSYIIGQPISYHVTVTNIGTGDGTATVADTVPAAVGSVTVSCVPTGTGTCTTTGSAGNVVAGTVALGAGESATYAIGGVVTAVGAVTNAALITPTTAGCVDQCGGGTAATPALTAVGNPVFTQTKVVDAASYIVGQPITYTITVTNTGTGPGTADLADAVPVQVTSVTLDCSAAPPESCGTAGSAGNGLAGTVELAPGSSATFTVTGVVSGPGDLTNTAVVTPTTPGCVAQCGGGTAVSNPAVAVENPVFTQTKTADSASYITGQPVIYTVTVTNTGGGPGTATLADSVPPTVGSVTVSCASTGTGTCDTAGSTGNSVAGSVSLGPGESATYTITGVVVSAGDTTNSATVTPTTTGCDTQCGGGTATTAALGAGDNPVFTQTKGADRASYIVGQAITYSVTVANTGTGAGTATLADSVPVAVGSVTVQCSASAGGICDTVGSTGNTIAGSVSLGPGDSATYTITGVVISAGSLTNTMTVVPTTPGCITQCGGGDATTPGIAALDAPVFTQTKTADQASYIVGEPIVYTVTLTNTGSGAGTATMTDTVPSTVGSVTGTCAVTDTGSCDTADSTGNIVAGSVNLGPGETAAYTITGLVVAQGGLTNAATVTPTTAGCAAQCGGGTAITAALSAGDNPFFETTKTADQSSYVVGQAITYTVTLTNSGAGTGTATLADAVPATVGSVTVSCAATGTGTCDTTGSTGNTVSGSVNLGPGAAATYTITGVVAAAGDLTNSVTVTPTTAGCGTQCGGGTATTASISAGENPVFTQTKTADAASYVTGQPIVYTVVVTNTGTGPGTATLADTVPATVGSVTVSCAATGTGTCDTTGSTGNTVAGTVNLGPGESATYTITGVVVAAGDLTNAATVTPTTAGCGTQCGGGTATTPSISAGDNPVFTQTKTADAASYIVGQSITYTVTVTNTGAGAGTATLADSVPATVASVTVSCTATGTGSCATAGSTGNTVAGSVDLGPGEAATYTISGVVVAAGDLTNAATVTPTTAGCGTQCGGGGAMTPTLAAGESPLFTQTKTADQTSYIVGGPIVYTVTVSNTGAGPGTAGLTDPVPTTVGSVAVSCVATGAGTCDTTGSTGNAVAGSVNLAPGGSATYTISGVVVAAGEVSNSVTVNPTTPGCEPATNLVALQLASCGGGSAATPSISAVGGPVFNQTKTADATSYIVGQAITYTVTVSNVGTGPGTATVTDSVPAAVGSVAVACAVSGTGTCDTAGSTGNSVAGSVNLGPGESATYTITGVVVAAGAVSNSVTVEPTTPGCDTQCGGGGSGTPSLAAVENPVFTQVKTADAASYIAGDPITYTITVTDNGSGPGTATLTDDVPAAVSSVSVTCSVTGTGGCDTTGSAGNTVTGSVNLGPGEVATYLVTGTVTGLGNLGNSVTVTPTTPGCTTQCGGGTASGPAIAVTPTADEHLAKTIDEPGPYQIGQDLPFSVVMSNFGNAVAINAQVADIPTGLTQISAAPEIGTYDAGTGVWTIPRLAPGQTFTLHLVLHVTLERAANKAVIIAPGALDPAIGDGLSRDCVAPQQGCVEVSLVASPPVQTPPAATPPAATPPAPAPPTGLTVTGARLTMLMTVAVGLLASGAVLRLAGRTRRRQGSGS